MFFRRPQPNPYVYEALSLIASHNLHSIHGLYRFPSIPHVLFLTRFYTSPYFASNGREVAVFDRTHRSYFQLPGSGRNRKGDVAQGFHKVIVELFDNRVISMTLFKASNGAIEVRDCASASLLDKGDYTFLPRFDHNFDAELIAIVRQHMTSHLKFYTSAESWGAISSLL